MKADIAGALTDLGYAMEQAAYAIAGWRSGWAKQPPIGTWPGLHDLIEEQAAERRSVIWGRS